MGGEGQIGKSCQLSLPQWRYACLPAYHPHWEANSPTWVESGVNPSACFPSRSALMMSREDDGAADKISGGPSPPPELVKSNFLADLVRLAQFRRRTAFLQLTSFRKDLLLRFGHNSGSPPLEGAFQRRPSHVQSAKQPLLLDSPPAKLAHVKISSPLQKPGVGFAPHQPLRSR